MKKKILGVAIMAAIAVTAGWNISKNNVKLADWALDNIEALASGEGNEGVGGSSDQQGYKYVGSPQACCKRSYWEDKCSSTWKDC